MCCDAVISSCHLYPKATMELAEKSSLNILEQNVLLT